MIVFSFFDFLDEYGFRVFLRKPSFLVFDVSSDFHRMANCFFLFLLYPLHYLSLFQEKDGRDLRKQGYRNDEEQTDRLVYRHFLKSMKCGVRNNFYTIALFFHNLCRFYGLSIPSILNHCRKYLTSLYLHIPRIYLSVFELYLAYQCASCALGHLPGVQSRGHLCKVIIS